MQLLRMGKNHFWNINIRVDFVKPFILTLLEIDSFGLFYKGDYPKYCRWFSRHGICRSVLTELFIIIHSSVKRLPSTTVSIPATGRMYLTLL